MNQNLVQKTKKTQKLILKNNAKANNILKWYIFLRVLPSLKNNYIVNYILLYK